MPISSAIAPLRWVVPAPKKNLIVGMADMLASNDARAYLVTYSLGSCVGVVIYDSAIKVGGLLHAMLPDSNIHSDRVIDRPYMFVDTGLPALFHAVYALGGLKHRLTVKLVGGAEFLDQKKIFNIGNRNVECVTALLARNAVRLAASETGGHDSRTVRLELATGNLTVESPGKPSYLL